MRSPRACAFTLVEVMFAAAVLALAIVGMIQVVVAGSQMLDLSRKQTIAAQIIHGQIDAIRLRDWSELSDVSMFPADYTAPVDASDQSTNLSKGFVFGSKLPTITQGFTCRRVISTVRTDLKKITFTVAWTGSTGRTYSRQASTYVGRNGLYVTYQRS